MGRLTKKPDEEIIEYRNSWALARKKGLIPNVPYPNWMKPNNDRFNDEGK